MFGIPLMALRIAQGLSRKQLAEGICSETALRNYETGKCEPEKLCADALLQRLGKTADKYYIRLGDEEDELAKQRTWMQVSFVRGKIGVAEYAIVKYQNMKGTKDKLHRQFLALMRAELLRRKNAPLGEQKKMVLSGLFETLKKRELSRELLKIRVFHLLELFLLQRYAILLEQTGEKEEAVRWYEALLRRFEREKRERADRQKLYPLTAYHLASLQAKEGKYAQALPRIVQALELLRYSKIQNVMYIMLRELEFRVREGLGIPVTEQEREYLRCLKEMFGEDRAYLWENYYPVYLEPYLGSVNVMLRERRMLQGRTREKMVGNVCDTRTLERQEKNGSKPQKRVWKGLFEELGMSYLKYDGGIVASEYGDYRKYEEMLQAFDKKDVKNAQLRYGELAGKIDMEELTNRQFKKYWGAELRLLAGEISREERNAQFWEMLDWTMPPDNREKGFSCWLTTYEKEVLESLAWDCEGQEIEQLLPLLKRQLHRNFGAVEQTRSVDFYSKLLYCTARGYLRNGDIRRAEQYITLAIRQRAFQDWGLPWNRILFLRFQVEEKKLGLREKNKPPESDEAAFRWAKLAWASAREAEDVAMCDFMKGYFGKLYSCGEGYLD